MPGRDPTLPDRRRARRRTALAALVLVVIPAAGLLAPTPAPAQQAGEPGVTYLCGKSSGYDCTADSGYRGQSVWGSEGPGHNCVSYVAYRLQQNGSGRPWPGSLGNGSRWDDNARAHGVRVDTRPAVGAIAQWDGGSGHVAYVDEVAPTHIVITEDAYAGFTARRRIDRSSAAFAEIEFIHVKDVAEGADDVLAMEGGAASIHPRVQGDRAARPAAIDPALPAGPVETGTTVGDFDGDGTDDLLLHRPGPAADQVAWGDGDGTFTVAPLAPRGIVGRYRPVAGDFDGDGADDLLLHGPGTAPDAVWWGVPGRRSFTPEARTIAGRYRPVAGDLDGDGADDVFLHGPGAETDRVLWGRVGVRRFQPGLAPTARGTYQPVAGDLDGDGADDLVLHGPGAVPDVVWWSAGALRAFTPRRLAGGAARGATVGDLDGDGADDLVLAGSATTVLWGTRTRALAPVPIEADGRPLLAGRFAE